MIPLKANSDTPDNKAKSELLKDAQRGNAHAQFLLGQRYLLGWGIGKDEAEAVKWWRQSAAQGDAGSENALGAAYRFGSGVSRDYSEAVKWFRMAAVHGDSLAQFNLGEMYLNGQGVAQNREEAKKWYKKSSVKGYKRSCEAYRKLNAARKSVSEIAAVPPEKRPLYLGIRSSHQKFFQRQPS